MNVPILRLLAVAGFCFLWASTVVQAQAVVELSAGMYRIEAEVAATPAERATGLMHRAAMAPQHGMLFVFSEAAVQCFWMKNTLIPLSLAFLDDEGHIVQIVDMSPQSLDNHCSQQPVRLALEMNAGWFRQRGLREGTRIRGLERLRMPHR